jgi:hypothetical protein
MKKSLIVLALMLFSSVVFARDTNMGKVHGVGYKETDDPDTCCKYLGVLHDKPGNIVDMDKECYAMGGNKVTHIQIDGSYCGPTKNDKGPYKYKCSAPMVGDCIKWN